MVSLMGENPRMLILMSHQATRNEVENVIRHVRERGYRPIELPGTDRLAIGVGVGALPGVRPAVPVSKPYKQVGREWHPEPTVVDVGGVRIGEGAPFAVAGGPCAVESRDQLLETARAVKGAGASLLRGGAYKPRTSPYSFSGLGAAGPEHLAEGRAG